MKPLCLLFLCSLLCPKIDAQREGLVPVQSARIKPWQGQPTIVINEQPQIPMLYALSDLPGGRWSWEEMPAYNLGLFYQSGFRLFQLDIFLEHLWQPDGSMDYTLLRRQIDGLAKACPEAVVFLRFHLNAPKWWQARYPEENTRWANAEPEPDLDFGLLRLMDGDARNTPRTSLASVRWRDDAGRQFRRFLREFQRFAESRRLAGIQVAGGLYGEWHYWNFLRGEPDVSDAMQQHFRRWAKEKYGTDKRLREAWAKPGNYTFDSIRVPGMAERSAPSLGIFRDPAKEQQVIDYYTCQHELVADRIIGFCRLVKENWKRPIITGTFYGYFFSLFNRQAAGGHLAFQRVVQSPWIDYLAGPQAYLPEASEEGQPFRSRALLLSMRLHGKLWLDEYDQEPVKRFPYSDGWKDNKTEFDKWMQINRARFLRSLLWPLLKGTGAWLYDFGPAGLVMHRQSERSGQAGNNQGWWEHPMYQESLKTIRGLYQNKDLPGFPLSDRQIKEQSYAGADVLVVGDTEVFYHLRSADGGDPVTERLIDWTTLGLFYSGVVFDAVHLDDLPLLDLSPYKAVIFLNTFLLDEAHRKVIWEKVARDGRQLFFFYAPGFSDGKFLSEKNMEAATGLTLKIAPAQNPSPATQSIILDSTALSVAFADVVQKTPVSPLFYCSDTTVVVLGRYAGLGLPALVRRDFPDHGVWFSGLPLSDPELLRSLLRSAGAHVYTDTRDIVYAGRGLIVLHTKVGGQRKITLKNGRQVTVDFPPGAGTVVLDAAKGYVIWR